MSKEALMVVLDVGSTMGKEIAKGGTRMDIAKDSVRRLIQTKLLFTKRDVMGLILVGSDETACPLNEENSEFYKNIYVSRELETPDLPFIESIDAIETSSSTQGDVIDGILNAMLMIRNFVGTKKYAKRIFVLTDTGRPIYEDEEQLKQITDCMLEEKFKLNVIGVDFKEDDDSDSDEDDEDGAGGAGGAVGAQSGVKKEEQEAKVEVGDARENGAEDESGRTAIQLRGEFYLKKLAGTVSGMVCNGQRSLTLLGEMRCRSVNPVTKFRGDLEVGKVRIPVYSYAKAMMQGFPTLKKMSKVAEEGGSEDCTVKTDRSYWNKQAEEVEEVSADQRVRSFKYGRQLIPFPEDLDESVLKYESTKELKVLCFIRRLPEHDNMVLSGPDVIVSEPNNYRAAKGLSALIKAMNETGMVAVVRYVKRKNAAPLMGHLVPAFDLNKAEDPVECLYFQQMPFDEDVREYSFNGFADDAAFAPSDAQLLAARQLIQSMDLTNTDVSGVSMGGAGENEDDEEWMVPETTFNPCLQRFYQCVSKRAFDPSSPIEELDQDIASYVNQNPLLLKRAEKALAAFKDNFPLERVVKADKSKKRHWRDHFNVSVPLSEEISAAKRVKQGPAIGGGVAAAASLDFDAINQQKVSKVGSVDPVGDFKAMIARRDDASLVDQAILQMSEQITRLVANSFQGNMHEKAVECMLALREGCLFESEWGQFNSFCKQWKQEYKTNTPDIWELMIEQEVTPIHTGECSQSDVSLIQSKAYLQDADDSSAIQQAPQAADEDDDGDIFASMD